eukprot:2692132-Alexandrium_andersonii.AAC.1
MAACCDRSPSLTGACCWPPCTRCAALHAPLASAAKGPSGRSPCGVSCSLHLLYGVALFAVH